MQRETLFATPTTQGSYCTTHESIIQTDTLHSGKDIPKGETQPTWLSEFHHGNGGTQYY
jgi:hypothetical protein